jgi:hypothetical protein
MDEHESHGYKSGGLDAWVIHAGEIGAAAVGDEVNFDTSVNAREGGRTSAPIPAPISCCTICRRYISCTIGTIYMHSIVISVGASHNFCSPFQPHFMTTRIGHCSLRRMHLRRT